MHSHLTAARLGTLQSFFNTRTDTDLLGCYAWTQAVGASLLPILGDLEVSLRNALHRGLSQYYANVDSFAWMLKTRPNPANSRTPNHWHKLKPNTSDEIQRAVEKIQKRKGNVTVDDIVAKLSFGFWETIIKGLRHTSHPTGMQEKVLAFAFPNAPDQAAIPYNSAAFINRLANLLYQIRDVRNRIGHHDQIWKTPEFDPHGRLGFIPRRPRHAVNSLQLLSERIAWLAGWIDPLITDHIKNSAHWWSLQALLKKHTLAIYRKNGGRCGTSEALLRSSSQQNQAWPAFSSDISERVRRLNDRLATNSIHF